MGINILAISQKYYKATSTNSWDSADLTVMKNQKKKKHLSDMQHSESEVTIPLELFGHINNPFPTEFRCNCNTQIALLTH